MQNDKDKENVERVLNLTSDEAMQELFSPEVVSELKQIANPQDLENEEVDCDSLPLQKG